MLSKQEVILNFVESIMKDGAKITRYDESRGTATMYVDVPKSSYLYRKGDGITCAADYVRVLRERLEWLGLIPKYAKVKMRELDIEWTQLDALRAESQAELRKKIGDLLNNSGIQKSAPIVPACFKTLGFDTIPTEDELKSRYREFVKKNHPDVGGDEEKFKTYQHAYEQAKEELGNRKGR